MCMHKGELANINPPRITTEPLDSGKTVSQRSMEKYSEAMYLYGTTVFGKTIRVQRLFVQSIH